MGIIQRKSIQYTLVNLGGVFIGMLSTLFIYPLAREAYGMARFYIDFGWLLYPIVLMGMDAVSLKFFPIMRQRLDTKHAFLSFLLMNVILISLLFFVFSWTFGDEITHWLDATLGMRFHSDPLIENYIWIVMPLVFCMGMTMLLNRHLSNFQKIVFPAVMTNLIKVVTPIIILMYFFGWVDIQAVPYGVLINFMLVLLVSILLLFLIGEWKLTSNLKPIFNNGVKELYTYSLFSLFASLGSLIAFRIDTVMVGVLLNMDLTGEFGIAATIAQIIAIPTNAIITVASPIISKAWADQEIQQIKDIYSKASINLLVPGLLLYTGMWIGVDYLIAIMPNPESFVAAKAIILVLGFAKILDMATSVNNEIIAYSKYYKFNFYSVLVLAISNVGFNLIFIERYGILGAAYATVLSLSIFNIGKLVFIAWRFKMIPFTFATVKLMLIALISYGIVFWWPEIYGPWGTLIYKCGGLSVVFIALTLYWKVSPDINELFIKYTSKLFRSK